jgi:ectoine hydroxylase-related dioxygenase (phytanoyl-CoA dioxygenase family)
MCWSTHCFSKDPGDGKTVAWHQDARYWPLSPHKNVTVWLAIDDSFIANGAMKVIPATHRHGLVEHGQDQGDNNVLWLKVKDAIDETKAKYIELKAGEISLHDDNLLHGSEANKSTQRRCGLTMRYCTPDVKCDLSVWPTFKTRLMRGVDRFDLNPHW